MASQGCIFWDEENEKLCGEESFKQGYCKNHYAKKFEAKKDSSGESNTDLSSETKNGNESKKVGSVTNKTPVEMERKKIKDTLDKNKDKLSEKDFESFLKKGVKFTCHVVLNDGDILEAGDLTDSKVESNKGSSSNHPDQTFFTSNKYQTLAAKLKGRTITEIITDCSLMPCEECFKALPSLMRNYFGISVGKKILITMYGHKPEGQGKPLMCINDTDGSKNGEYNVLIWGWEKVSISAASHDSQDGGEEGEEI